MNKYLLMFIFVVSAFFLFPDKTYAQEKIGFAGEDGVDWACGLYGKGPESTNDIVNGQKYMHWAMKSNMASLSRLISGFPICNEPGTDDQANTFQNSAIGYISSGISTMYANPPANTAYFAANIMENMGLVKPVYAQGIGY